MRSMERKERKMYTGRRESSIWMQRICFAQGCTDEVNGCTSLGWEGCT